MVCLGVPSALLPYPAQVFFDVCVSSVSSRGRRLRCLGLLFRRLCIIRQTFSNTVERTPPTRTATDLAEPA